MIYNVAVNSAYTAFVVVLVGLAGFQGVIAQSTPVANEKSFQRVYRQHKFFIEGFVDLTGDGKPDAYGYQLQSNGSYQNIVVLPNNGSGGFENPIISPTTFPIANDSGKNFGFFYGSMIVGDLNNDGKRDVALRGATSPAAIFTMINNGSGVFTQTAVSLYDGERFHSIADLNGDGRGDLVAINFSQFYETTPMAVSGSVGYRMANADGTFGARVMIDSQIRLSPAVADFDDDGKPDIAYSYYSGSNGSYYVKFLRNLGGGIFSGPAATVQGVDISTAADIDGDGKTDAAVYRNSNGSWWIRRSSDGAAISVYFGLPGDIPVPADYNGDGKSDIAVFRPSDGVWYILISGTGEVIIRPFGANGDKPVVQDYDGDGKFDVAIFRPATGDWWISKSSDGGTSVVNWGISTDVPIPADYDMDGKADISVFRQGIWYILRGYDNNVDVSQFGISGDTPMAVDSNSDGVLELSVFRGAGTWYASPFPNLLWADYSASRPVRIFQPNN